MLSMAEYTKLFAHRRLGGKSAALHSMVSIEEYRILLNDQTSTDEQIVARLSYIEKLCREIIREELERYKKQ